VHFVGDDAPYFPTLLKSGFTLSVHPALTPKLERLFAGAYESLANGFSQQSIICASQIVRHILGLLFFSNQAFSPITRKRRVRDFDQVIQFMKQHIDGTLTIDQIARQAGLSPAHLSRLFRDQVGFPPIDYFNHLKVQRACRFLTLTPLRIKEIGSRLGYSDQYYFSRVFHKVMGISPAAYRRVQSG
jgi:AraC-like DNA-binding protein